MMLRRYKLTRMMLVLGAISFATALPARGESPVDLGPAASIDGLRGSNAQPVERFQGQHAKGGLIDLTPTNGFFDDCFRATDPAPGLPDDVPFIKSSFGALAARDADARGTARWHLWCPAAGEVKVTCFMVVPAASDDHEWTLRLGEQSQAFKANTSDGQAAQTHTVVFNLKSPGHVVFSIDCSEKSPARGTQFKMIRLQGEAIAQASLLRTRWRPAAVHTKFAPEPTCKNPRLWVFETQGLSANSSYVPITTPFGYFGTPLNDAGRVKAGAGFNFSMWLANRNAQHAPPTDQLPQLIATSLPHGEFGSFGGEGTGVRMQGTAYPNGADRIIQALRVEKRDEQQIFYGYFYDETSHAWKLYAAAEKPLSAKEKRAGDVDLKQAGSFCEVPGPPATERSGDVVRVIRRRGWFMGEDQTWSRAGFASNRKNAADDDPADTTGAAENPAGPLSSRQAVHAPDFTQAGWMIMSTGGIGVRAIGADVPANIPPTPQGLPEYLTPEKTAQLFALPVEFAGNKVADITRDSATVTYNLRKTGENSKGILYYGPQDCLTYLPREIKNGSPVERELFGPDRTWPSSLAEQNVQQGDNAFKLHDLKPGTTYFYRLYVHHDQGKSWDYASGQFQTK